MGFGGAILVYVLSKVIMDAGYRQTATFEEGQNLLLSVAFWGFIAFSLIGLGLWLIIHNRLEIKASMS